MNLETVLKEFIITYPKYLGGLMFIFLLSRFMFMSTAIDSVIPSTGAAGAGEGVVASVG